MGALDDLLSYPPSGGQSGGTSNLDALLSSPPQMSWGEVGSQALKNAPADATGMAIGIAKAGTPSIMGMGQHLYQSAKTGLGVGEKILGIPAYGDEQRGANEIINWYKGYTSIPGIKKNIAEHPVGVASDVLSLVTPIKKFGLVGKGATAGLDAAVNGPRIRSVSELKAEAGAGLNTAKESGVYFLKDFVKPLQTTLTDAAHQMNFRPGRPGSDLLGAALKDVHAMTDRPWSFDDVHTLQKDLNEAYTVAKRGGYEGTAGIAGRLRGIVNQFLDKVPESKGEGLYATGDLTPEQATHIHQENLKVYRQAKVAQTLESMGKRAEVDASQFVQSGEANALRKYVRQVLRQHYKNNGGTGFNANEIRTLEEFNKGSVKDWIYKQGSRYFGGAFGAFLGSSIGSVVPGIGHAIGAGTAYIIGEGAKRAGNRLAVQKFNRFVESVRAEGSSRLDNLLSKSVHDHVMGTEAGSTAIKRWQKSIGTSGYKAASRGLAVAVAASVKRPDLVRDIYAEIEKIDGKLQEFASKWQGSGPADAQPKQPQ